MIGPSIPSRAHADLLPYYPDLYRLVKRGKDGTSLYGLDGRYYVEIPQPEPKIRLRRVQFFSFLDAAAYFVGLQEAT